MIIAVGDSKSSTFWKNQEFTWLEFLAKFKDPVRTKETTEEYKKMPKEQKNNIKDVGGFVGGELEKNKRKQGHVKNRIIICLDIDNAIDIPEINLNNVGLLHSTHTHTQAFPRYRIIIPLLETLSSDEYEFVARYTAKKVGIFHATDLTTYQATRLMFWPSCCLDGEYIFKEFEGDFLDGRAILGENPNWKKEPLLLSELTEQRIGEQINKKQQDPTTKTGPIAAFCKAYSIEDAIEKYIPEYEPTDDPRRYTWAEGSTFGGILIFESLFSYSFHSTDPASMRLCNAYDLIRLHKFKGNQKSALVWVVQQPGVSQYLAKEEFSDYQNWMSDLEYGSNSSIKPTINNMKLLIENGYDKKFSFDELAQQPLVDNEQYRNYEDSLVMQWLESNYKVYHESKTRKALDILCHENSFHPIKDWLNTLEWDRVPRVDQLLIKYFGCEDTLFTREAIRKTMVAACKRVFEPGCEVQHVLVFRGDQDIGKSTFFKKLCKKESWFSDSMSLKDCGDPKTSGEQLAGSWIIEIPEMAGIRKRESQDIRGFIVRQVDKYRPAYGYRTENFPRQCILVSTVNEAFLQDTEGNRRFWVVTCPHLYSDIKLDIDQLWAEALYLYRNGENLRLSDEGKRLSVIEEHKSMETDDRVGIIHKFLDQELPPHWDLKTVEERLRWLHDEFSPAEKHPESKKRDYITTIEVWCELFQKNKADLTRAQSNLIIKCFIALGWCTKIHNFNTTLYGRQTAYERPKSL